MYYSNFHTQCNQGEQAEEQFKITAKKYGFKVKSTTKTQNKLNHIDFIIKNKEVTYNVDVKSKSRMGYTSELSNNLGYTGSLFGSADLMAYVDKTHIYLVDRLELIALIKSRLVSREILNSQDFYTIENPYFRIYQRKNYSWLDEFVVIPSNDIASLAKLTWII